VKKIFLYFIFILFLAAGFLSCKNIALAHLPRLVYLKPDLAQINNPELSQAFYDELKGQPRDYFINSDKDFELYINLLVPAHSNPEGRYSADVFLLGATEPEKIEFLDGQNFKWEQFYEEWGRDYYLKGPELSKQVSAGEYRIQVYSSDNQGKYVLAVGKKEQYGIKDLLNVYWQIPTLKTTFFNTSVFQFFLTPFGIGAIGAIGGLLILLALINYLIGVIKTKIKHAQAKTLLLASSFPEMKDEIIKFLQKPAYDVTVAFITTAAKPQEDLDYLQKDWTIMKEELGFNVEELDIEGKTEAQVEEILKLKDIIYVEGGNTFYLLRAMRKCNFEKIIRKLLKEGKVYIGASAGSIVAGRTIKTAGWKDADKNIAGITDFKGLNLVPFDIFVHYTPEWYDTVKAEMPDTKDRQKNLRILTDGQAVLVQGKEIDLIGEGEAIVI